ncbi:hypothetical protein RclHR1_11920001 [Rhizophagus clarus]|uniref:Uncharacterized protein n=1 Tax=Rhizophagus clarus TaxID=94130 RepID=A0A2Z6Q5P2_9GLOM|nr:hypothetical protein RclHR1_11920001 [Rhizophagus clarus]
MAHLIKIILCNHKVGPPTPLGIIADQHKGQTLGLGQYLNSRYLHLTPIEHLQHIYKLCQVHYKRNIVKNKHFSSEIRSAMYFLIPTLNTQEVLMIVLNKIQLCDEPGAAAWTKDKLDPWVLSVRTIQADKRAEKRRKASKL